MRIGFDAKRAFHNFTGLGNYSRTLIHSLANTFPEHQYQLFNPKTSTQVSFPQNNIHEIKPGGLRALFPSLWRSRWMLSDIRKACDIYHGLSHELPYGAKRLHLRTFVTIHDLIFETYPEQYGKTDVLIYRRKFKYAAEIADQVIAISEITKADLMHYYHIPESKIKVVYQACDQRFFSQATPTQLAEVKQRYQLQTPYWLFVGSLIERKNLLRVCEALRATHSAWPLFVVGKGEEYKQRVQQFLKQHHLEHQVIFLEDHFSSAQIYHDLPALYQLAFALIYPSVKEGFGLPVIEAMASGCPVITSEHTSMAEAGKHASILVDPLQTESIAEAMNRLYKQEDLALQLKQRGIQTALAFTPEKCATNMMTLYLAH